MPRKFTFEVHASSHTMLSKPLHTVNQLVGTKRIPEQLSESTFSKSITPKLNYLNNCHIFFYIQSIFFSPVDSIPNQKSIFKTMLTHMLSPIALTSKSLVNHILFCIKIAIFTDIKGKLTQKT